MGGRLLDYETLVLSDPISTGHDITIYQGLWRSARNLLIHRECCPRYQVKRERKIGLPSSYQEGIEHGKV